MDATTSSPDNSYAQGIRFVALIARTAPRGAFLENLRAASSTTPEGMRYWEESVEQSDEDVEIELGKDWTRLFRGIAPGYGPCPPYELAWRPQGDDPARLLEFKRLYATRGLGPAEDDHERPDHLSFLLDFAAALVEDGDQAAVEQFAAAHLDWIPGFCAQAREHARTSLYRWYLDMLEQTVRTLMPA